MNTNLRIANEIWEQMKCMDRNLIWCMGVTKKRVIENGLRFKVNGLKFKGDVAVILNGKDLYDVQMIKARRKKIGHRFIVNDEIQKTFNDLFFDQLMPVLEGEVEK